MLNFPDILKLTNDVIFYNPSWPLVTTKFLSDIPKFKGKSSEDLSNHITTFLLWCSSNSLINDSIRSILFQHTLNGNVAKWYIKLKAVHFLCLVI